ncbi:MAG: amidohydrolase [Actinobacteria bacterium]|nr:MAG: amidohydrolase [Actinomycetota bacterium]
MDRVIIVSADGHASMPSKLWPEYLEREYHELLPRLTAENELSTRAMTLLNDMSLPLEARAVFDTEGVYAAGGWAGLWDVEVRVAEMDREGTAAEFVFFGDFRTNALFHNVMNASYPPDAVDAGARAYDRWALDTFGSAGGRLLVCGAIGACLNRDALLAELDWVADHGFIGTYAPGFMSLPGQPPLYDEYWDPVWARYADRGLVVIVHGGYGLPQGFAHTEIAAAAERVEAAGGSDMDLIADLGAGIFNDDFFTDLRCRRALWQFMLGGVFDRHPDLKVMMTEVRGDWLPATLRHLDSVYADQRSDLPARRSPSEYWQSNCMAGLSFMHQAEVEMRHEIGIETIDFGRDYPHTESTWPNTLDYLKVLFAGVPADETRLILGENAIRFLGLDRGMLTEVANRIGPNIADITDPTATIDPALLEHLAQRCGVLKPAEGALRLPKLEPMLRDDLVQAGAPAGSR